jgi:GT2 family glycosyltransferase
MMVHRSVIEDIGLFDQRFFAYCEDVDFAFRARIAGYRCAFVPDAAVLHTQCGTGSTMPRRRLYYIQRNMELAIFRNLPGRALLRYALPHIAYALFQVLRGTFQGQGINGLRAKVDSIRLWPAMRAVRGPVRISSNTLREYLRARFLDPQQMPTTREQTVQEHAI